MESGTTVFSRGYYSNDRQRDQVCLRDRLCRVERKEEEGSYGFSADLMAMASSSDQDDFGLVSWGGWFRCCGGRAGEDR